MRCTTAADAGVVASRVNLVVVIGAGEASEGIEVGKVGIVVAVDSAAIEVEKGAIADEAGVDSEVNEDEGRVPNRWDVSGFASPYACGWVRTALFFDSFEHPLA